MKKQLIFATLLLSLGACTQQEDMTPDSPQIAVSDPFTGTAHDIYVNILTNRFDGYHKNKPDTRAESAFSITPYTEDGDTLMYIVQYEKGWELYSASPATNMLIFSSDEGVFDMEDQKMPEAMKSLLASSLEKIEYSKELGIETVDQSWGALAVTTDDLKSGKTTVTDKNGLQRAVSYPEIPPGEWVLIDTEVVSTQTHTTPKHTLTRWHQSSPWNMYSKKVMNPSTQTLVSAPAGCVPIAVGQYMYYTHYKDGVPKYCRATATLNDDGVSYSFNGTTAEYWDFMSRIYYLDEYNKLAAIFIGELGYEMKADYSLYGTNVTVTNLLNYLTKTYGSLFSQSNFNYSYVKSSLDQGYPVLTGAGTKDTPTGKLVGHLFLIDRYSTTTSSIKYTYGLKRDPWNSNEEYPWADDEVDEYGNIISYAYTNEVVRTSTSDAVYMNWGAGEYIDNVAYNPYSSDWQYDDTHYNYQHTIIRRVDVQ